jgi:DNA topoisomerase-3
LAVGKDKRKRLTYCAADAPGDVTEVVNAATPTEGELIFRTVYHLAGCAKPMKRCGYPPWRIPPSAGALTG